MSDLVLGIRLTADGKDLVGAVKVSSAEIDKMTGATKRAGSEAEKLNSQQKSLGETLNLSASMIGLYSAAWNKAVDVMFRAVDAVKNYVKESALLNARHETMGVVLEVIGRNAGYSRREMDLYAESVRRNGITMIASREGVVKMAQANLDLADASKLARAAQDAAVIANINSSEAFTRLIYAIQSGQPEMLRTMGINATFETSYAKVAKQLGLTVEQLTEQEKVQARANVVLQATTTIAGTYEAAMDTAGKKLNSLERYTEDLKVKLGETFNDALVIAVDSYTDALKGANTETEKLARDNKLKEWGRDLVTAIAYVVDQFKVFKIVIVEIATPIERLYRNLTTVIASWRILLSTGSVAEKVSAMTQLRDDNEAYFKALDDRLKANRNMRSAVSEMEAYFRTKDGEAATRAAAQVSGWDNDMDVSSYHGAPGKRPAGKAEGEDPMRAIIKSLREKLLVDRELNEVNKLHITLEEMSAKQRAKVSPELKAQAEMYARQVDAQKLANEQMENDAKNEEALQKLLAERAQFVADLDNKRWAGYEANQKNIEQIQFETELIGLSNVAREQAVAVRALETSGITAQDSAYTGLVARLKEAIADRSAKQAVVDLNRKNLDEFNDFWRSVEGTGKSVFTILAARGENMAERIGESIESSIVDMLYQLTARKWIINIGTSWTGLAGMSGAANAANTGSGILSAGSTASNIGGLFSGGMDFGAGFASTAFAPAAETAAMIEAGTVGAAGAGMEAGALMTAGSAIPYVAAAIAAAYALGLFDDGEDRQAQLVQSGLRGSSTIGRGGFSGTQFAAFGSSLEDQWAGTQDSALPADMLAGFNKAIGKVFDDMETAAAQLGLSTAGLESLTVKMGATGNGVQADMTAALQSTADTIAQTLMPNIADLQQSGETLAQTFGRLAAAQAALDAQRRTMEIRLMELQGDKLGALAERRKDELAALDPTLRALQEQIYAAEDLATAADGAAGSVRTLAGELDQVRTAATAAVDAQIDASRNASQAARQAADSYRALTTSLADAVRTLRGGDLSPLLPGQKLDEARANVEAAYARAATGDAAALASLPQVATDFLTASRAYNASSAAYTADFDRVMQLLGEAGAASNTAALRQDYQATLLEIQTGVLQDIKEILAAPVLDAAALAEQTNLLSTIGVLLRDQTGVILTGNTVQDVIRNINELDSRYSEAMLRSLIEGNTTQTGSLVNILAGTDNVVSLLGQLVDLTAQKTEQDAAAAAAAAQQAADERALAERISQATAAYRAQQAVSDVALATFKSTIAQTGVAQAVNQEQDIASGTAFGYKHFTYYPGQEAIIAATRDAQAAYMSAFSSAYDLYNAIPGHAAGLNYVPHDDYLMRAHQGEAVLTAPQAADWRAGGAGITSTDLAALRQEQKTAARETLAATQEAGDRQVAALRKGLAALQEEFAALRTELRRLTT